jgi:hypothetical protein
MRRSVLVISGQRRDFDLGGLSLEISGLDSEKKLYSIMLPLQILISYLIDNDDLKQGVRDQGDQNLHVNSPRVPKGFCCFPSATS